MKSRIIRYTTEAVLGTAIAVLLLWIAFSTVESILFVYQGY